MADWMAFDPADYVTNTMHLTTRQHGGYILLICAAWSGKGFLPGTDAGLASIAKLSPREWREDGAALKAFLTRRDDEWVHERVEFEWNDAQSLIAAKSKAGKEGARKRWQGRANGKPMAVPSGRHRQTDAPLPLPLPSSEEPNGSSGGRVPPRDVIFAEGLPWLMRKSAKSRDACAKMIGHWLKETGDNDQAVLDAMQAAERENPADPFPWIAARLKPKEAPETWNQRRIREGMEAIRQ